ncbi:MAG: hypothetical protein AMJ78_01365 [Omnitrophica WOR_2 bacterium SM23_29]|nr:MAG: hypothetical protein AMJ78_01365 [Omnitrophica WOR_2 bacterium SM23_29]
MNLKELKEMINLMNENNLVEIEVEREGLRVRIKKGISNIPEITQEKYIIQPTGVTPAAEPTKEPQPPAAKRIEINAPMVGTFYRAPAPDAPPFVEVGDEIEPGQVICIIEAMKLMNEIKTEVKGKVAEILVENAEPIEFGQPLFLIEPTP